MGDTSDIRKGAVIMHQNDLYVVSDAQFVNPGKGSAFTKTKMKSIASGKTIEITYKSGEKVETVQVEHANLQYLYQSGDFYSFMNQDSYENFEVEAEKIGDDVKYLKEGLEVVAVVYNGAIVAIELPKKIKYKVVEAPFAEKGNSASGNVTKTVTFDNGLKAQVPIFIKEGEEVLINTDSGDYVSRVNE
jgi:elongation factor P